MVGAVIAIGSWEGRAMIEATIERYREQFTELDILVANLTSTSDYLTSQLETLENSWDMTG